VARDDSSRPVGELLAVAAANVAVVPIVVAFVALGGVVLAGRAAADVAAQVLARRNDRRLSPNAEAPQPPASR